MVIVLREKNQGKVPQTVPQRETHWTAHARPHRGLKERAIVRLNNPKSTNRMTDVRLAKLANEQRSKKEIVHGSIDYFFDYGFLWTYRNFFIDVCRPLSLKKRISARIQCSSHASQSETNMSFFESEYMKIHTFQLRKKE